MEKDGLILGRPSLTRRAHYSHLWSYSDPISEIPLSPFELPLLPICIVVDFVQMLQPPS